MTELMWSITIGLSIGLACYFPLHYLMKDEAIKMPFLMALICWFYGNFFTTLLFGSIGHFLGYGVMRLFDIETKSQDELLKDETPLIPAESDQEEFEEVKFAPIFDDTEQE